MNRQLSTGGRSPSAKPKKREGEKRSAPLTPLREKGKGKEQGRVSCETCYKTARAREAKASVRVFFFLRLAQRLRRSSATAFRSARRTTRSGRGIAATSTGAASSIGRITTPLASGRARLWTALPRSSPGCARSLGVRYDIPHGIEAHPQGGSRGGRDVQDHLP